MTAPGENKLRILYHHRTLADGAEGIHIREMVRAFRALGHEVRVVALVDENRPCPSGESKPSRWSVVSRWLPGISYEFAEIAYNWIARRKLKRELCSFRPNLIYDRYNSYSTAAVRAGKRSGIPVYLEVNAPVSLERVKEDNRHLRMPWLTRRYERFICHSATHLFAVSTPLKEYLVGEYGIDDTRISVLPNGVNLDNFQQKNTSKELKATLGLEHATVIGFVGILRPWHGVDQLLQSLKIVAEREEKAHLLIVGDGPSEESLRTLAEELRLSDRVTFTGRVEHSKVREYIACMDIAVSPKATFYASPMKILEYMAMNVPVVAPDTLNIRDLLTHERDSLLFAENQVGELTGALMRFINDPLFARQMADAALIKVRSQQTWTHVAMRVLEQFSNSS